MLRRHGFYPPSEHNTTKLKNKYIDYLYIYLYMMAKKQHHKKLTRGSDLYMKIMITQKTKLPFELIGGNIDNILLEKLTNKLEGKCNNDGFIKPNSISIITYSSGIIIGNDVIFNVALQCLACRPVEGTKISCVIRNITKAGIRAEINNQISPLVIFIARDHHHQSKYFSSRQVGDKITARVIGQRFELNDKYISVIATLVEPKAIA